MRASSFGLLLVAACGGSSSTAPTTAAVSGAPATGKQAGPDSASNGIAPTADTAGAAIQNRVAAPSPLGTDASKLPLAISGIQQWFELSRYARLPTADDEWAHFLGKDAYSTFAPDKSRACVLELIPKIKGVYEVSVLYPLELERAKLIHGSMTVVELAKCAITLGDKRKKAKPKDPRITELGIATFTQLQGPWILWTPDTKGITEVLATESATPNPLGAITATQPASVEWFASALDFSWAIFAVPSLGAVFEYDNMYKAGPIAIRILFADVATAKQAVTNLKKLPDRLAQNTALGELVTEVVSVLRTKMKVTIEGSEVVLRGTMTGQEKGEDPFDVFRGFVVPVRRPLTAEEENRLLRPLPGSTRAKREAK